MAEDRGINESIAIVQLDVMLLITIAMMIIIIHHRHHYHHQHYHHLQELVEYRYPNRVII